MLVQSDCEVGNVLREGRVGWSGPLLLVDEAVHRLWVEETMAVLEMCTGRGHTAERLGLVYEMRRTSICILLHAMLSMTCFACSFLLPAVSFGIGVVRRVIEGAYLEALLASLRDCTEVLILRVDLKVQVAKLYRRVRLARRQIGATDKNALSFVDRPSENLEIALVKALILGEISELVSDSHEVFIVGLNENSGR